MLRFGWKVATVVGLAFVLILSVPVVSTSSAVPGTTWHLEVTPAAPGSISAFSTGMPASLVLGQPNLTGSPWLTANQTAFQPDPEGSAMSPNGTLWVVDYGAHRVLEFLPPFTDAESASLVIGQSTFTGTLPGTSAVNLTGPGAAAVDAHGDLWVADTLANRVLEFVPPFHTGMAASVVLGQSSFAANGAGATAVNLSYPVDLSFDALGDLWVADTDNNRVVEYVPPFATGMAASVVVGQDSLTGSAAGTSAVNLSTPWDAEMSDNILWVADGDNERVVGYPAPIYTGEPADYLLGQASFTSTGGSGPGALAQPLTVSTDASGDLWVSDATDNRVVEFSPPFATFESPTISIGQTSLSSVAHGDNATTLSDPFGAFVSPSGDLWVTDANNNRILEYVPAVFPVRVSATGLPPGTSWTASVHGTSQSGTGTLAFSETNGSFSLVVTPVAGYRASPSVESFDVNGTAVALTVEFLPTGPNPFSVGMAASIVLGQPNFTSAFLYPSATAQELSTNDFALAFDASGDLWVADADFNRVLEYRPPFSNDMAASLVLGQSTLTGAFGGIGAANLSYPDGLAFDPAGDLFVANFDSNRVAEFTPPFTNGMTPTAVIGQSSLTGYFPGAGPANLSGPAGLAYDNGSLWVTDYGNNRVLEFPGPVTTGESATLVLGQSNLEGSLSGTTAVNESEPASVAFDAAGNLWVADYGNNRVLRYDAPLSTGEAASVVIGQPNMTTSDSTYPSSLSGPNSVWLDAQGNLWVADSLDNRVVEYLGPAPALPTNETASEVVGQGSLDTYGANTTATGLAYPSDALTDPHGNLWVLDGGNERVLGYVPAEFSLNFTETGLPAGTSWSVTVNGTAEPSTSASVGVAEENGTFAWTAAAIPGYVATPGSGTATVNGARAAVAITYVPFTYAVTFRETGLPSGTNWSVEVNGVTHSSSGATILVDEPNGTYGFRVGTVAGYAAITNSSGNVLVSAGPASVTVNFASTSLPGSGSTTPPGLPLTDLLLLAVVLIVIGAIAAVWFTRRRKGGASPGEVSPPPGASGLPPPPRPPGS